MHLPHTHTDLASSSVDRNQIPSDILRCPTTRGFIVPILCGPLVRMASSTCPVEGRVDNSESICTELLLALPPFSPFYGQEVIFLRTHTGKPPGKAGIPEPSPSPLPDGIPWLWEELCLSSFDLSVCKPGSPWGSIKGTGCHFHPHSVHKDPIQPHGSDSDNAKPNRQQKPLEPSLFLDLGRRKADLGGRSLEIDSCLLPRRMSKGDRPAAKGAVVHKTFSRCP